MLCTGESQQLILIITVLMSLLQLAQYQTVARRPELPRPKLKVCYYMNWLHMCTEKRVGERGTRKWEVEEEGRVEGGGERGRERVCVCVYQTTFLISL